MRTLCFPVLALLSIPVSLAAKGETIRITIEGDKLADAIAIIDKDVIARYNVWGGPGTFTQLPDGSRVTHETHGPVADWARGATNPPQNAVVYKVSFVTTRTNPSTYVVKYSFDPVTKQGYVYIPGKSDPEFHDNTWLIYRGVEGNWFYAAKEWDDLAQPLIGKALGH